MIDGCLILDAGYWIRERWKVKGQRSLRF